MSTRCSLQPSSAAPPKSSGPRSWAWTQVPNAPSKMRTRSSSGGEEVGHQEDERLPGRSAGPRRVPRSAGSRPIRRRATTVRYRRRVRSPRHRDVRDGRVPGTARPTAVPRRPGPRWSADRAAAPPCCPVAPAPSASGSLFTGRRAPTASSPITGRALGPDALRRALDALGAGVPARQRRCLPDRAGGRRGRSPAGRARGVGVGAGHPAGRDRIAASSARCSCSATAARRPVARRRPVRRRWRCCSSALDPAARRLRCSSTSCAACSPATRGSAPTAACSAARPGAGSSSRRSCSRRRRHDRGSVRDRARRSRRSSASRPCSLRQPGDGAASRPGRRAPWRELTRALGWLLAGSLFAQALINTRAAPRAACSRRRTTTRDRSVPRQPDHRAHPRLPLPGGAGGAAPAARRATPAAGQVRDLRSRDPRARARARSGCSAWSRPPVPRLLGPTVVRIAFGARTSRSAAATSPLLAAASCIYLLALTLRRR